MTSGKTMANKLINYRLIGHQPGSSGDKVEWGKMAENFTRFAKNSLFNFLLKTLQERQKYNSRSARLNIRFYPTNLPRYRRKKTGYRKACFKVPFILGE